MKTRTVVVAKGGVARVAAWDDTQIIVNDQDMAELIEKEIKGCKPIMDCTGRFAGKITITVELYGDFEDEAEE